MFRGEKQQCPTSTTIFPLDIEPKSVSNDVELQAASKTWLFSQAKNRKISPSYGGEIGCFANLQLMIQVKDLTITQICTMYHDKSLI